MERKINEINKVYDKILNSGLLLGTLLGSVAYTLSVENLNSSNFFSKYIIDAIILLSYLVVYIFKNKISTEKKSLVVVIGIAGLVVPDLLELGLQSENKSLLILIPFFTFLGFNIRRTLFIYSLVVLMFLVCGYMVTNQLIVQSEGVAAPQMKFTAWIIDIIVITIVSFVFVIVVKQFHLTFYKLIDNLKQKNIELADSEKNYREIFNSTAEAIFIQDTNGKILDVNKAMLKMYGYEREEISKIGIDDISAKLPEYTKDKALEYFKETIINGKSVFDWMGCKKDGTLFWVEIALRKTTIAGKDRILAVVRDIDEKKKNTLQLEMYKARLEDLVKQRTNELEETNEELLVINSYLNLKNEELKKAYDKLKNAQERMVQSEKLASLGMLATGVAHEINNPLNFIQGGLIGLENFFKKNYEEFPADIKYLLFSINEGIKRSETIVNSLSKFSKGADGDKEEKCELHHIIKHCLIMLNNQCEGRITITKKCHSDFIYTKCNEGQLHQVFLNILTNAVQSIEGEGEIEIESILGDSVVTIKITDTGCGMDEETLANITEPFFTTKIPGQGTGLGMSITSNIIAEHNGRLSIKSEENKGTVVEVQLPLLS